ncbi:hypothetical protein MUP77_13195, partial [Candidatus Bathyarchaeota archaeon]|nr:hypothetical protein [Candidatus Bathyarchaeota archaeon]
VTMKLHVTLSIDSEVFPKFKAIVPNVSADVEAHMRCRLAENGIAGEQKQSSMTLQQYDHLSREFIKVGRQVANEEAYLRKIRKFDVLMSVCKQAGLDQSLSNLRECSAKMSDVWVVTWKGNPDLMREFLIYLGWSKHLRELGKQLSDVDNGKVKVVDASAENGSAPEAPAPIPA